ncbi:hypothetical protein GPX89_29860 [Nocardia sp. ET3-3]|uniref:HEAT repeat domain-containing protein n=1 Tax=Nocardia terrae TaxID=2675851 RepID=A0A7K1V476_9NOCA|nr:hypothetical protein [Nocardia terrae]MVU81435.1 hypothetical protein [Nocardia terrae]
MRELALISRRLAGSSELASVLTQLSTVGTDGPRLALHMAMAARDLIHIQRVLAGPDPALRRAALRAVRTLPVSDAAIAAAMIDAPTDLRRAIYRALRHGGRTDAADSLLPTVRSRWGDREAAALLPACSGAVVSRALPELLHEITAWRAIGRGHPRAVLDAIDGASEGVNGYHWWKRCQRGFAEAARLKPERALDILETHRETQWCGSLPAATLRALIREDADRTADLVIASDHYTADLGRKLLLAHRPALPVSTIVELIATGGYRSWRPTHDLSVVPPRLRESVFDALVARDPYLGRDLAALPALRWLPPERAAAEARRMLEWHGSVWHSSRRRLDDPLVPLRIKAHLSFGEAAQSLHAAAYGGDARTRGTARVLLIECAARSGEPAVVRTTLLEVAQRTRHEQDPVRADILESLALLRVRVLDDELAPALTAFTESVVQARDASERSMFALRRLISRVIRHTDANHAPVLMDWAFGSYARLIGRFGYQALRLDQDRPRTSTGRRRWHTEEHRDFDSGQDRLDRTLPRGMDTRLLAALEPQLRGERERRTASLATTLAKSLGRRAEYLTELQADLRAHEDFELTMRREHRERFWFAEPARHDERVAELLVGDPRVRSAHDLWRVVACERPDLLAVTLTALRAENEGWLPDVTATMAAHWTDSQRDQVREVVASVANTRALPVDTRLKAVRSLGLIPGSLTALAELGRHDDIPIAEAALDAAARIGGERVMTLLLDRATGPTSAAAVAAMARCAGSVPPSELGQMLVSALTAPDRKIIVRKQAARLLERHRAAPLNALLHQWNQPELHRDVRTAIAVALQHWPEESRALDALLDAAIPGAGDLFVRTLCRTGPLDYAPSDRPRYAALVRRLLTASEDPGVRFRTTRAFSYWAPWYDGGFTDLIAAVGDPSDPRGADELPVLLALLDSGAIAEEILPPLEQLVAAPRDEQARDRVRAIIGRISRRIENPRRSPSDAELALARAARRRLVTQPLFLEQATSLAVNLLPRPRDVLSARRLATELVALAALLRDRPVYVGSLAQRELLWHFTRRGRPAADSDLLPAATALTEQRSLSAQLMALSLIENYAPTADWSPPWRDLLTRLRASEHVEIEQRAWDLSPRT